MLAIEKADLFGVGMEMIVALTASSVHVLSPPKDMINEISNSLR